MFFNHPLLWRQITDAVVAAYILNATLVVPKLDRDSFWKDPRSCADHDMNIVSNVWIFLWGG